MENIRRVALITGGTGGLGKAICKKMLDEDYTVYCCDIKEDNRLDEKLKNFSGFHFIKLDVSSEIDWIEAYRVILEQSKRIDTVINNAGINIRVNIEDCTVEQWDRMFQVNVRGIFLSAKHGIPIMKKQGYGSFVNISSICGLVGHLYTNESYTATKGAVTLLTKSIATRYAQFGIRCNSVHPSTVDTEIVKTLFSDPQRKSERLNEIPMKRLGLPTEVAEAVAFLASESASFINGVQLPVDGGLTAY